MNNKRNDKSNAKTLKKGVRVTSQTKIVVENVRRYFDSLKRKGHYNGLNVVQKTVQATGLSEASVKRIHSEYIDQDCKFLLLLLDTQCQDYELIWMSLIVVQLNV